MKPIIGITTRSVDNINKVPQTIIDYLKKYDAIPILIPDTKNIDELLPIINKINGFIIPGGYTFHKTDEYLIKYAIDKDIPLIGICAGMQAIGSINDFNTYKSDRTVKTNSSINHNEPSKKYVHEITIIDDGLLYSILKSSRIKVNSRHENKIKKEDYFIIDAVADDGIIEAIHIPGKRFILGLEWHPEDLNDKYSKMIFKSFVDNCKK